MPPLEAARTPPCSDPDGARRPPDPPDPAALATWAGWRSNLESMDAIPLRAVALVLLASAAQGAQVQDPIDPASAARLRAEAHFLAFRDLNGPGWNMVLERRTGGATFLGGGRSAPAFAPRGDGDFADLARLFVEATEPMTGVEVATLALERVTLLPLGAAGGSDKWSVRLRQELGGVRVIGGFVNVLFDARGNALSLQSTALPGLLSLSGLRPVLDADRAARGALGAFQRETGLPGIVTAAPELGIGALEVGQTLAPALVWQVEVQWHARGYEPEGRTLWIDALDGAPLRSRDSIHHDVSGTVDSNATPGTRPDVGNNPPLPFLMKYLRVTSAAGTEYTDASGAFNFAGETGPLDCTFEYVGTYALVSNDAGPEYVHNQMIVGTGNVVSMNIAPTEHTTAQANAFMHVGSLRDWIRSVDPGDDTADFQAHANVNLSQTCNAYFDGNSVNFFAAGGSCPNTGYSTVVAHEMGHWLNVLYGTGNGYDGMGEGNADVFAMYEYDTPLVGEDFFGPGTYVRTGTNTRQYCGDCCPGCHGGVHANGEVWMGAAWKIRERLDAFHGNSLGDAIANGLFSAWMTGYDQTAIHSVIELQWLTLDDDDGNLDNGTPSYDHIDGGFRDQGFPGYDLPPILIQDVTDHPDTTDEVGPYLIEAFIDAQDAPPLLGADLLYRVDDGPWTSLGMIPGAMYSAFIPGQVSPATVDYYVWAMDANGTTATFPDEAPAEFLEFSVGVVHVLLADDFEGDDDNGWTHASFGDTSNDHDDFQRGLPQGRGGDPLGAFSGEKAWGNDLGAGAWNGLYQNNQHDWLRSPTFDCSQAVGTELRFRRWLNVQAGAFDQARVTVNGVAVWVNDVNATHADDEWKEIVLDVAAQADGQPEVSVEFSLQSDGGQVYGGWNVDDVEVRYVTAVGGSVGTSYCFGDGSGTPCPCANWGAPGEGCANSTGAGALLAASGSASVGADDLVFAGAQLVPGQPALLFAGLNAVNGGNGVAFGDGLRCAGGSVRRLGVAQPDAGGNASWGPGLQSLGGWGAGDTRHFQAWYRDPGGSPCATSFNLSHGVSVDFVP